MIARALATGIILAAAFVLWLLLRFWLLRDRDEDTSPFNWQGTVPAAPGQCSCGAPHARKLAPLPADPAPPLPEMIAAPVTAPPSPQAARPEPADDSLWDRHAVGVGKVWALLNAEVQS